MPDGVEEGLKPEEQPKPKDAWDKTDILGKLLGSIFIPIGLAFAGFKVNSALQDRAAQQQTAQIAITVLQAKEAPLPALRTWAKGVFIQMLADANNPLSAEAEKELQTTPLPSADDSSLPTACPFDATKVSGKELAERFEGTPISDEEFAALEETIKSNVGRQLSDKQAQDCMLGASATVTCFYQGRMMDKTILDLDRASSSVVLVLNV